ncbi:MAG: Ig-like domain-containing protein [Nitrospirae bacterium]|nr:Ig-like domain-containing protein [Nitrospirota bacterium]
MVRQNERPRDLNIHSNTFLSHTCIFIALILSILGLTACGSGGDGGKPVNQTASTTITGQVIKGPVSDASVTIFELTADGTAGDVLATTRTDETGRFGASVRQGVNGPVFIEATGGTFTSPVTGEPQTLPEEPGSGLQAVVNVKPGEDANTLITPLTTIAVQVARDMPGGLTASNIDVAGGKVGLSLGVGSPFQTKPINPSEPGSATGATQEEINHGLANEGIQLLAEQWQLPYQDIYREVARDVSDGVLDGKQGDTLIKGTQGFLDAVTAFSENPVLNRSGGFFAEPETFGAPIPGGGELFGEFLRMNNLANADYCETLGGCPGTPYETPHEALFPTDNTDLIAIQDKITGLKAALAGCDGTSCGDVTPLQKQLLDLETYLDAYLKAMNAASAAAALHHASLIGLNGITQVNLDNVRRAIVWHETLHNIGSAILDLLSIEDFVENLPELANGDKGSREKFSVLYEVMKDSESLLTTLLEEVTGIKNEVQLSAVAPKAMDLMIAYGIIQPGDSVQKIKENLDDLISQFTDMVNVMREVNKLYEETPGGATEYRRALSSSKDVFRGFGQMIGTVFKIQSKQVLEERKQNEAENIKAMAAETGINLKFYLTMLQIEARRTEAERTLIDVRRTRIAVMNFIVSSCGWGPFVIRPEVPSFTIPDAGTGTDRYKWGSALTNIWNLVEKSVSAIDTGILVPGVATSCPKADAIPESLLPLVQRETTECPECQPIADKINLLRAYRAALHEEKYTIQKDIDTAYRLELEQKFLLNEASNLLEQNQLLEDQIESQVFVNASEIRLSISANQQGILQRTSMSAAIQNEIERLRAEEGRLVEIEKELVKIQDEILRLLEVLITCQESLCPAINHPPTADAGPDQTVPTGTTVFISGNGSTDPDGDPLTYAWRVVSKPAGSNESIFNPYDESAMFFFDVDGDYVFELVVQDGQVSSAPDRVTIHVTDPSIPTVTSVTPQNNATNVPVDTSVTVTFSKPIDTTTFGLLDSFGTPVSGRVTSSQLGDFATFNPDADLASNTTYTVKVTNSLALEFTSTFTTAAPVIAGDFIGLRGTVVPSDLDVGGEPTNCQQSTVGTETFFSCDRTIGGKRLFLHAFVDKSAKTIAGTAVTWTDGSNGDTFICGIKLSSILSSCSGATVSDTDVFFVNTRLIRFDGVTVELNGHILF